MTDVEISRYKCLGCNQKITLYGGHTSATSVICEKCGKWMAIDNVHGLPKIIHKRGDAGNAAFNYKRQEFNTSWRPEKSVFSNHWMIIITSTR